jgi:hypothetical protein
VLVSPNAAALNYFAGEVEIDQEGDIIVASSCDDRTRPSPANDQSLQPLARGRIGFSRDAGSLAQ